MAFSRHVAIAGGLSKLQNNVCHIHTQTEDIHLKHTVQITFIFIDFRVCDFAFAFCFIFRQISICVLNTNETFV